MRPTIVANEQYSWHKIESPYFELIGTDDRIAFSGLEVT